MRALMRVAITATFLFVGLALGASGSATAKDPSPDLMRALMTWAAPQLDLPVPDELPIIVRKGRCALWHLARGDEAACPADEPGASGIQAAYGSGVMWLSKDWSADSLKDVSILLHELVHHMQHHAGVPETPCKAETWEKPAYDVQFAFLEAAGVDPYETIGVNDLMLLFVTNCTER